MPTKRTKDREGIPEQEVSFATVAAAAAGGGGEEEEEVVEEEDEVTGGFVERD